MRLTTHCNYQFALLGQEQVGGHSCYVLQLTPKRNDAELVNGKAWIDASSFQIRRIAGTPAKKSIVVDQQSPRNRRLRSGTGYLDAGCNESSG